MSKKNKNKFQSSGVTTEKLATPVAKETAVKKTEDAKDEDIKQEFKNLALVIFFILVLLAALYYFDQKDQILDQATSKLFNLF
jgi:hypothetical protein